MAVATTDVPGRYDVVINVGGTLTGYVLLDSLEGTPFSASRAAYSYSPTFLARQNVGEAYGDNAQDFFLTASQSNWDLGEGQRFFRQSDPERSRRYWTAVSLDPVSIPGQVTMRMAGATVAGSAVRLALAEQNSTALTTGIYTVTAVDLLRGNSFNSWASLGAHGLGAAPSKWGLVADAAGNAYITTTASGTVGVRKWNGTAFSTFSATACDSLAHLNNTLFGFSQSTGALIKYDTAGAATVIYTWRDAAGAALTGASYATRLRPFGAKLAILRTQGVRRPGELWIYDGTNTTAVANFPNNFVTNDLEEVNGILFVSGYLANGGFNQPAIFYYVNGQIGQLWRTPSTSYTGTNAPAMAGWSEGLAFTNDPAGAVLLYNLSTGGVHTIATYTINTQSQMAASRNLLAWTLGSTDLKNFPGTTHNTTGSLTTSLFDFDNTLTKAFRGVKVEFAIEAGTTSTFDIAYQVDSVDGSWTNLQTAAVSGTEYSLSGVTGRAIAFKITFNLGNATTSPALKRVYVRAAPQLQSYAKVQYILDLTGSQDIGGRSSARTLRDGTPHPLNSAEQAKRVVDAIAATSAITVTDRVNGSFTAACEPSECELYELHPGEGLKGRGSGNVTGGIFVARLTARQI